VPEPNAGAGAGLLLVALIQTQRMRRSKACFANGKRRSGWWFSLRSSFSLAMRSVAALSAQPSLFRDGFIGFRIFGRKKNSNSGEAGPQSVERHLRFIFATRGARLGAGIFAISIWLLM
jgi:hypothetical protein